MKENTSTLWKMQKVSRYSLSKEQETGIRALHSKHGFKQAVKENQDLLGIVGIMLVGVTMSLQGSKMTGPLILPHQNHLHHTPMKNSMTYQNWRELRKHLFQC